MKNFAQQRRNELLVAHTLEIAQSAINMMIAEHGGVPKGFKFDIKPREVVEILKTLRRDAGYWQEHLRTRQDKHF